MKLWNMPTGSLGRLALGLLALLCVLYALYIAFLMPPLVKYVNSSGVQADGRVYCQQQATYVKNSFSIPANFPDGKGGVDWARLIAFTEEQGYESGMRCLSETSVNTPLLLLKTAILLIIGVISALLASRLQVA